MWKKESDLCMRWFLDLFGCLFSYASYAFVTLVHNDFPYVSVCAVHAILNAGIRISNKSF